MVRDTSNPTTKARSSKHAAATGLKTGNLRTKGEQPLASLRCVEAQHQPSSLP